MLPSFPVMRIRIAHSPDADDAFMFHALATGRIDTGPYAVEIETGDIDTLNRRASSGDYEITALSFAAWARLHPIYRLMATGASFGKGYGPVLVAREQQSLKEIAGAEVAVPGEGTTAALVLRLAVPSVKTRVVPFESIADEVLSGRCGAGVIIHEGQLTYAEQGLTRILDLGAWWHEQEQLPLPLGGNAVKRDLPLEVQRDCARIVRESVAYGMSRRTEAVAYARGFSRGVTEEQADRFVSMYVNDLTLDCGEEGRRAVARLMERGHAEGHLPPSPAPDFVEA